ncbi:BTB/POZ domain-containing protein 3-like [Sitodiplosis mosellana]|uniref:BTB/POZ domain-containing protein 3-like n=1 Tax=Sitodiplosis mosellana TaxID=263140 RepID=UPI00244451B8|nr:BTB/POZ domain-containing protein 3-like [Sitodiplosis mosellana]
MSMRKSGVLQKIQNLYLNPNGADVWFVFDGERVPGHKFMLTASSPWLSTMFNGSLPEDKDVDMTNGRATVDAFKEFLQFSYMDDVTLTMENIEGVIDLAKQSLADDIFEKCEEFLIKSLTNDSMFFGYQLALMYEAKKLKTFCEDEICSNAEKVFKSSSFLEFPYEFLENVLRCDELNCEEKDIFDACIAWAQAACTRNNEDPSNAESLRAQLKESIYQIRFCSMTKEDVAACIRSCRGLFTANELEEIVFMVSKASEMEARKFNWTARRIKQVSTKGQHLHCSRFNWLRYVTPYFDRGFYIGFGSNLETTFTCNQRVLLNGFTCEYPDKIKFSVNTKIIEMKSDGSVNELYNQRNLLDFSNKRNYKTYNPYKAHTKLSNLILLRPNHTYTIEIQFPIQPLYRGPLGFPFDFNNEVRVDHDIIIKFKGGDNYPTTSGIICSLDLIRTDEKKYIDKIKKNPLMVVLASVLILFILFLPQIIYNIRRGR